MTNSEKLRKAISILKNNVDYTNHNSVIDTEEMFSKIIWLNGENESLTPPSEITWEKVKIKMTEIQAIEREWAMRYNSELPKWQQEMYQ